MEVAAQRQMLKAQIADLITRHPTLQAPVSDSTHATHEISDTPRLHAAQLVPTHSNSEISDIPRYMRQRFILRSHTENFLTDPVSMPQYTTLHTSPMKLSMHMRLLHTAQLRSVMISIMIFVRHAMYIIKSIEKMSSSMQTFWEMSFILIPPQGGPPR